MQSYDDSDSLLQESDETGPTGSGPEPEEDSSPERISRSLRIGAAITAVGLAIFAVVAIYVLISNAGRRPPSKRQPQSSPQIAQQPLIVPIPRVTPDTPDDQVTEDETPDNPQVEELPGRDDSPDQVKAKGTINRPDAEIEGRGEQPQKHRSPLASLPVRPPDQSGSLDARIPQGARGTAEARLIRARSTKAGAGYRYDLTFTLEDLSGQATQWERLVISTRATSGANRVQTIPFFHRLGSSGSLTFTLSVEMRGRAETDWRGRVVCTAVGYDRRERPARASFATSLAP
jgi:hypothetical protein